MKVTSFKNCNSNSVLQFKDINVIVDKDCNVIPSGCVNIGKTIKSAKVRIVIVFKEEIVLFWIIFRDIIKSESHQCL